MKRKYDLTFTKNFDLIAKGKMDFQWMMQNNMSAKNFEEENYELDSND